METRKEEKERSLVVGMIVLVVIIVALALVGLFLLKPAPEIIQGQAEATQVRVSGKLPGRVVDFWIEEGEQVHAGDTLVHIHSSLAEAKLLQAEAMENAAKAQNEKVDRGTRIEVINSMYDVWQQAQAGLAIAQKSYDRMQALYEKGVVSAQKRDEAEAAYKAMVGSERAAYSQYQLAKHGAQAEDKLAAAAMVTVARGGVAEVESLLEDSYLLAPTDGEISDIFPNPGELVSLGAPIMNVLKLDDMWVSFNVREDLLEVFPMGTEVQVTIPALNNREATLKVYYIRDMGAYAVWRATKVTGQYDAKTFQVKARPVQPVEGLRPGMSVLLKR